MKGNVCVLDNVRSLRGMFELWRRGRRANRGYRWSVCSRSKSNIRLLYQGRPCQKEATTHLRFPQRLIALDFNLFGQREEIVLFLIRELRSLEIVGLSNNNSYTGTGTSIYNTDHHHDNYKVFVASEFVPIFGSMFALPLIIGFPLSTSALFFNASCNTTIEGLVTIF